MPMECVFNKNFKCDPREHLYVVYYDDEGSCDVVCEECLRTKNFPPRMHVYEVGDEVTHYFM